ncbi:short-chain dehydrogenase [Clohesyomyces aquaticus]|uniref:Short-chain dehydrogenase n=1 Tax=Clohesyomyces aquaticus TaxID=1231657 RepID=A0A1Y1Z0D2_9PLEO|nr:short-chain dehydrogenase [Clohesyomyces aquaticus]
MALLSPYAKQHESPQGPGDARPTATQIVSDQGLIGEPSWSGRVVLITGCSPGGLGPETAKAIHLTGADVYMTVRDLAKGTQIAEDILADGRSGKVEVIVMDLESLESLRTGAKEFLRRSGNKLNILINNAGVMACPKSTTLDGFERHLGTNHLGHFYLFHQVKAALLASASRSFNSRVISLSSAAHRRRTLNFDDLNSEKTEYDPILAYSDSKLANIYFANELDRLFQSQNLRALSVHPGGILTPLARYIPGVEELVKDPVILKTMKNPAQGAATTVWAAIAKELEGKGGLYLDEVAVAELTSPDALYYAGGYATHAFDPEAESRLWEESLKMTGLAD